MKTIIKFIFALAVLDNCTPVPQPTSVSVTATDAGEKTCVTLADRIRQAEEVKTVDAGTR